jgi:hypothetical protein
MTIYGRTRWYTTVHGSRIAPYTVPVCGVRVRPPYISVFLRKRSFTTVPIRPGYEQTQFTRSAYDPLCSRGKNSFLSPKKIFQLVFSLVHFFSEIVTYIIKFIRQKYFLFKLKKGEYFSENINIKFCCQVMKQKIEVFNAVH